MGPAMSRPPPRPTAYGLLVAATALLLLVLGAGLASQVGRPYPGFTAAVAPELITWPLLVETFGAYFLVSALMLAAGILVYRQNPAARPNR